jgi:mono/diheme cytochrome c family protein
MKKAWLILGGAAVIVAGGLFLASAPQRIDLAGLPAHTPDAKNGELIYHIGGCISCHAPSKDEAGRDPKLPSGGAPLATPIGTFYPPNITPDKETGIGDWSDADFVNALKMGVSEDGENFIPAFPYPSYHHMTVADILDLKAYLFSLPAVQAPEREADVPLEWFVRRGIGLWKRIALTDTTDGFEGKVDPGQSAAWNRGAYLVNGPGHCAECHTPRNALMIGQADQAFAGGPHPAGEGKVPSLRNLIGRGEFDSVDDLATGFKEGEDGGYGSLRKGGMAEVQKNISYLPDADIHAIAEYIGSLK